MPPCTVHHGNRGIGWPRAPPRAPSRAGSIPGTALPDSCPRVCTGMVCNAQPCFTSLVLDRLSFLLDLVLLCHCIQCWAYFIPATACGELPAAQPAPSVVPE